MMTSLTDILSFLGAMFSLIGVGFAVIILQRKITVERRFQRGITYSVRGMVEVKNLAGEAALLRSEIKEGGKIDRERLVLIENLLNEAMASLKGVEADQIRDVLNDQDRRARYGYLAKVLERIGALTLEAYQPTNLNQIPEPTADFVGREEEIETLLSSFVDAAQGAVIIGMGGVGKTELAKVLAKRLKDRFPDGQIYFNLRGARDDDSVMPATAAEALSHVIRSFEPDAQLPEDDDALQGKYYSVLEDKRVLLLMDNALNAGQLAPLTPPPNGCALMVTSRHRFELSGMVSVDIDTLPPEETRELLLEICPRIGEEADALAERCGNLPLALRLAASALKSRPTLGVAKYIADLGAEQGLLTTLDKYKDRTDEEQGVEASLAISYKLLNEGMQGFWRALAVFPGDFDSAAATAIYPFYDRLDADTALGDLHAASMVQWTIEKSRFRLHPLARYYALSQLSKEEHAEVEPRHAAHYFEVLRRVDSLYMEGGNSMILGLALFDLERSNIEAGQAWAAARRGTDTAAAKLCSDYPNAGVYCLSLRLHSREWVAWIEEAVEAARSLKDRHAEGNHLGSLGLAYAALGETRKAIKFYELQLVIVQEIDDRSGEGNAVGNLGTAYTVLGETRKAIDYLEQALVISQEIGDRRGEGNAVGSLGNAYMVLGETRKAIDYLEQALVISQEIGDRSGEGADLGNLGLAYAELGETRKAIDYHEKALVISQEIGERSGEGADLGNLGLAYAALGETPKAIEFYDLQLVIVREIGDRRGEGNALGNLGSAYAVLGETRRAIAHIEKAMEIYEAIESPHAAKARAQLEELRKSAD